jgi:hypothetical protein
VSLPWAVIRRNPACESLVGISSADIEKVLPLLDVNTLSNDALDGRVLVDMRSCFVCLDDYRGLRNRA